MPTPQEVQRAEQRRRLEAQRRLPTPSIRPLPLPNINADAFRRLTAGPSGAVNVAGQPARQLTPAEILRNVTAGGRLPTVAGPPTPARPPQADPRSDRGIITPRVSIGGVGEPTSAQIERAMTVAGQGVEPVSLPVAGLLESGLRPSEFFGFAPPAVTTPQSPFALNAGEFHRVMQWTSGRILEAVSAGSRNFLPGQITDVIATLLPWRDWGFESYQEALRALGYTEIPGAGTWIKDEEILSTAGVAGGGTSTQFVTQRANFGGGGGGGFRSPQFSTLINWRI